MPLDILSPPTEYSVQNIQNSTECAVCALALGAMVYLCSEWPAESQASFSRLMHCRSGLSARPRPTAPPRRTAPSVFHCTRAGWIAGTKAFCASFRQNTIVLTRSTPGPASCSGRQPPMRFPRRPWVLIMENLESGLPWLEIASLVLKYCHPRCLISQPAGVQRLGT